MQWAAKLEETLSLAKAIIRNNSEIVNIEMSLSLPSTLSKPTMRTVFKDHGQIGFSVVSVLVTRFMDSFGFSTKMSPSQIEVLTVDTLENFSYESLEDIVLFFKMARTGKFGSTKKGVDSNLIFGEWFSQYLEHKAELREREHQKIKGELSNNPVTIEDVKSAYQKAAAANMPARVKAYVDKITKDINREQLEILIEEWNNDQQKKPYIDIIKRKRLEIKSE